MPAALVVLTLALFTLAATGAYEPQATAPEAPSGRGFLSIESLLGDPTFNDVLSRSFECILSDSQHAEYIAEDEVGRFVYRKRFWTRCDPTPATEANEFLEEHLRRLAYSLEYFCPNGDMDWDQRGDVALRFGLPTSRSRFSGDIGLAGGGMGIDPPSETWGYGEEGMTISFIDASLNGHYQTGYDIKHLTYSGRPEVHNDSRDPSAGPYEPPELPVYMPGLHAQTQQKRQSDRGLKALGTVDLSYGYTPPVEPLPLFYEIVTARGPDGTTDVAVNYQVPRTELDYIEDERRARAILSKRLRVLDEEFDVLSTHERSLDVLIDTEGARSEDDLLTDEWRFHMRPGTYILGLAVQDNRSGRTGSGRSLVEIPDYSVSGLSMSDIQLARGVGEGARFRRMGGAVSPHPIHAFHQNDELVIYFELYGLTEDIPGIGRFTVTTEVTSGQYEPDRGWFSRFLARLNPEKAHSISTRVIGTGPVPDTAYWFSLALPNLAEDNYELSVTVKDVRSGQEITRTAAFTVLED
jgi:GWxTD domain-containing protein